MGGRGGSRPEALRVFADTSVLFAALHSGARATWGTAPGASLTLFQVGQAGVIELVVSEAVLTEASGLVRRKLPHLVGLLDVFTSSTTVLLTDAEHEIAQRASAAVTDEDDAVILATAAEHGCAFLITLNPRHFPNEYGGVTVLTPGELVARLRRAVLGLRSR